MSDAPTQSSATTDPKVAQVFLDQAREAMRWNADRADTFDRRAGVLLGFSGVTVAVLIGVGQGAFADQDPPGLVTAVLVLGGLTFLAAGAFAMKVLTVRTVDYPSLQDLTTAWTRYQRPTTTDDDLHDGQAIGLIVNQYLAPENSKTSPVGTMAADANARGTWLKVATWTFGGAVVLLIIPGAWALTHRLT